MKYLSYLNQLCHLFDFECKMIFSVLVRIIQSKDKLITQVNFLFARFVLYSVENSVFTLFNQRGGSNPLYATTRFDSI